MAQKKNIDVVEIQRLHEQGLNSVEIAKKLDCSPVSIRYYYSKLGLEAQSRSEAARKYYVNHNYFNDIDSPNKAYILGLLYADGCNWISSNSNHTKVILELIDREIVEKVRDLINPEKPIRIVEHSGNSFNTFRLDIISQQISQDLVKWGMFPRKSLNLVFPDINHNLIRHFIRGYFDGDGSVTRRYKIHFIGNIEFLKELQDFLVENLNINRTAIRKNSVSDAMYFTFGAKNDVYAFYNMIYLDAELFIKRKKEKFDGFITQGNFEPKFIK